MALMCYGPGDWERIRIEANLNKTSDQIEMFYDVLLKYCNQVSYRTSQSIETLVAVLFNDINRLLMVKIKRRIMMKTKHWP